MNLNNIFVVLSIVLLICSQVSSQEERDEGLRRVPSCNCIAFRVDAVQDYAYAPAVFEILNIFKQRNTPITLGIIGHDFGTSAQTDAIIKDAVANTTLWPVEIAMNGWVYRDYRFITFNQTIKDVTQGLDRIKATLDIDRITTFIPPGNDYNNNTMDAIKTLGFKVISGDITREIGPFPITGQTFYRFSSGVSASQFNLNNSMIRITSLLNNYGFAVVSISADDYTLPDGSANQVKLNQLRGLLYQIYLNATLKIVPVGKISPDFSNQTVSLPATTGSVAYMKNRTCNCVAFRLDDIQDYFCRPSQIAVMETFREFQTPLAIGIVGAYFHLDVELVSYVQNAVADPCWRVGIFNHGYYHEDFSNLTFADALFRLNQSNTEIYSKIQIWPRSFVPPFNEFNNNTLPALKALGFTHFSSQTVLDPPPYDYAKDGIHRFPIAIETNNPDNFDYYEGMPHTYTWDGLTAMLKVYGYANVMMHAQEFAERRNGLYTNTVNLTMVNELRLLLTKLREHPEIRVVLLEEIQDYYGAGPVNLGTTGQFCHYGPVTTQSVQTATTVQAGTTGEATETSEGSILIYYSTMVVIGLILLLWI